MDAVRNVPSPVSVVLVLPLLASSLRRSLRLTLPVLVGVGSGIVAVAPAPAASGPSSAAKVTRGVCTSSATDAKERAATFRVRVGDAGSASTSYGFRAVLQEKQPHDRWRSLTGSASPAGLNVTQTAQAGARWMKRTIKVQGLRPGSRYRLRVTFRWTRPQGTRSTVRHSRSCRVHDKRPNLDLRAVPGWIPSTTGGQVAYRVTIKTARRSALPDSGVRVVVRQGDRELGRGTFRPESAVDQVLIHGDRCLTGQPITVEVDPQRAIDEQDEDDNLLTVPCRPESR